MHGMVRGALGGLVATVAMTLLYDALRGTRGGPRKRGVGRGIPPEVVAMRSAAKVGMRSRMTARQREAFTLASHFGYGAAMGGLYGAWRGRRGGAPCCGMGEVGTGVLFGLGVYAGSYAGWLPAAGLLAWPHRQGGWMTATLVAGHVVYGAVLGAMVAGAAGDQAGRVAGG